MVEPTEMAEPAESVHEISTRADAAGDPSLTDRTWVLLTEAPEGGWGLHGHANTNAELVTAARAQIAELGAASKRVLARPALSWRS